MFKKSNIDLYYFSINFYFQINQIIVNCQHYNLILKPYKKCQIPHDGYQIFFFIIIKCSFVYNLKNNNTLLFKSGQNSLIVPIHTYIYSLYLI